MTKMQNHHPSQEECSLKEASPHLGNGNNERLSPKYDLVEQMLFIYMRAVKARILSHNIADRKCSYYIEANVGKLRGITKHLDKSADPEWNQVFAFSMDCHLATVLEVTVKKKDRSKDESLGAVLFDLNEMPERVPPDSPLAPQWYRLENQRENTVNGEVMLAVWIGTQADEAFPEAWHSDFAPIWDEGAIDLRSKVYASPKLWYVRVNVIEVQDIQPSDKTWFPQVFARVVLGNQSLRTRTSKKQTVNHMWNEDLMFVAAEPFEELVVITVEDMAKVMGKVTISLQTVEKRINCEAVSSKWYNLEKIGVDKFSSMKKKTSNEASLSSRIHLRISLDGGYHVLDEPMIYSSDLRPTAKQLWQPCIGILELGILGAQGLSPMKIENGQGTVDAYCVAKYGQKWIRTRTIVGSLAPKWNEQYAWEVYEPCTVLTIGVFDNCHLQVGRERAPPARDNVIGKVRVRVSTLESDRIYVHFHPLLVLNEAGLRKTGEIQLALRFTCLSLLSSLSIYLRPPLPKMHYIHSLPVAHFDMLRHHSAWIVSMRLGRAEPPLRPEAVEYMLDVGSHTWSVRKSKVNFFRIINSFRGIAALVKWFNTICSWKCPLITGLIHILLAMLVLFPKLILSSLFINLFFISVWRYRRRPRSPPHSDAQLSLIGAIAADELCEEFDAFPTGQPADIVKVRYDRLRIIAGRVQTLAGDLAAQAERVQSLLSWRDPRATALFSMFCLVAAAVLYVVPLRAVVLLAGFYVLRHPRFRREEAPSVLCNFFRRLPAKTDCLL